MEINKQIAEYIDSLPAQKRKDMLSLHETILLLLPGCKVWFFDGKDNSGKVISNPNIGYGTRTINYSDGNKKEFYQIGISGNSTGISVYVIGLEDKNYLKETIGKKIGKASVIAYCIKFKTIADINMNVLSKVIIEGSNYTKINKI